MGKQKVLLLGASGYVGKAYQKMLRQKSVDCVALGRSELDYTVPGMLQQHLDSNQYDFLICAAGYTGKPNVDACELYKHETLLGNAVLPGIVRTACESADLPFGYVSSGCIYTGSRSDGSGFTEDDEPNFTFRTNNCSFYSGSKALGEEVLKGADAYIWRLRIPFSHEDSSRNFLSKLMRYERLLEAENSISHLYDFVQASIDCWLQSIPYGLYNITNPGKVTTSQVVQKIIDKGLTKKSFSFFDSEDEFMAKAAKTPRSNCVLSSNKLIKAGVQIRSVDDALNDALDNWEPEIL